MIVINRKDHRPVHEQLVEQLRYLVVSGQYQMDETLPSTRSLAEQVGVSFHTVRKAYQQLEQEGLLASRQGSGYVVIERKPLQKAERMEQGAGVVQEALQRMIGLGLDEGEVEYLFQEQLSLLEGHPGRHKLVFAAPYLEMAAQCAAQITMTLQQPVEATTIDRLGQHRDADFLFTPFPTVRRALDAMPKADVIGVVTYLNPDALGRIARLLGRNTLGLITRSPDALTPLMNEIRAGTGFAGQVLAATIEEGTQQLRPLIEQTDLVAYSPACRRRMLAYQQEQTPFVPLKTTISRASLAMIRQAVPA